LVYQHRQATHGKDATRWYDCVLSPPLFAGTTSQSNGLAFGQGGNFRGMSADDERDADRWRRLEAEARTIASKMTDPEPRRIMLFIAEGYKLLADRAEFRKTHNDQ